MLEVVLGLFVFGSAWFWLLFIAMSAAMIFFLEYDKVFISTVVFVVATASIVFLGNQGVIPWIIQHPWHILGGVAVYFLSAMLCPIIKWDLYVNKIKEFVKGHQLKWIATNLQDEVDSYEIDRGQKKDAEQSQRIVDLKQTILTKTLVGCAIKSWETYVDKWEKNRRDKIRYGYWDISLPLRVPSTKEEVIAFVEENKSRIIGWMTYWPWVMTWTLINDPIRKIMRYLFYRMKGIFVGIAMKVFGVKAAHTPDLPVLTEDEIKTIGDIMKTNTLNGVPVKSISDNL